MRVEAERTASSSSGVRLTDTGLIVLRNAEFDDLGLLGTSGLGFLTSEKYVGRVRGPVITTHHAAGYVPSEFGLAVIPGPQPYPKYDFGAVWSARYLEDVQGIGSLDDDDPEEAFWTLHARLVKDGFYPRRDNEVGEGTHIHPTAVLGTSEFGLHRGHGLVPNAGYVRIGNRVFIGAQTCVDRSIWKQPTSIGDDTCIDNLVHVAHNVQIGRGCMIIAGTVIGGSAVIGDDVFIGIGARIRPGVRIGDGAFIGMSVTVLEDVSAGARVTCRSS